MKIIGCFRIKNLKNLKSYKTTFKIIPSLSDRRLKRILALKSRKVVSASKTVWQVNDELTKTQNGVKTGQNSVKTGFLGPRTSKITSWVNF